MYPDICSRCLIHTAIDTHIVATTLTYSVSCGVVPYPHALYVWYKEQLAHDAIFETDTSANTLKPITTWMGDPICEYHLRKKLRSE